MTRLVVAGIQKEDGQIWHTCYLDRMEAEFQRRDLLPLAFEQKIVHL